MWKILGKKEGEKRRLTQFDDIKMISIFGGNSLATRVVLKIRSKRNKSLCVMESECILNLVEEPNYTDFEFAVD